MFCACFVRFQVLAKHSGYQGKAVLRRWIEGEKICDADLFFGGVDIVGVWVCDKDE
jgi:hypothetical protein